MNEKLVIIDKGVDSNHKRLKSAQIDGVTVHLDKDKVQLIDGFEDDDGHGTAVASIIHKENPSISLFAVKLSTDLGIVTEKALSEGIRYCYTHRDDLKIINISLGIGSNNISEELRNVCSEAMSKGIVIVASAHNFPSKNCYPAYFPFVLGVASGIVKQKGTFKFLGKQHVNILAKGTVQRVAWKEGGFKISSGTSFAAAHFAGILSKLLQSEFGHSYNLNSAYEILEKHSDSSVVPLNHTNGKMEDLLIEGTDENVDDESLRKMFSYGANLGKVALFPASEKEIGTIIEFENQSKFIISRVFDYPRLNSLGKVLKPKNVDVVNSYIKQVDLDSFDSLVVGYFLDQPYDANIIYGMDLIDKCMQANKNFFVFDRDVYKFISGKRKDYESYTGKIIYPEINISLLKKLLPFKYIEKVKCPILMVLGTGSRQGKVTAQLKIKSLLEGMGYKISHIGTEPQTLIQGADFIFPFGHKSTVQLGLEFWTDFLNIVVNSTYRLNNPDLIITGGQGGVVKKIGIPSESGGNTLKNLHYLMDVKPDAVILTVNYADSFDFIGKTINTIKTFHDVEIPLILLKPPSPEEIKLNDTDVFSVNEAYNLKRSQLEKEFKRPVINIKDDTYDKLVLEVIQDTFS